MKAKISLVWICLDSGSKKDPETPVDELHEGGEGEWTRELLEAAGGLRSHCSQL